MQFANRPVLRLDEFKNVTVRLLRDTEVSDNLRKTFNVHAQQRQCKRLHQRMKQAVKSVKDAKLSSSDDEDASNSGVDGSSSSSKRYVTFPVSYAN